jgi:hypothetical protein
MTHDLKFRALREALTKLEGAQSLASSIASAGRLAATVHDFKAFLLSIESDPQI